MLKIHKRVIYKVCYLYATDPLQLDDLYQETVLNLWKAFPRFRGDSSPSTWIYRICLNTYISFRRKSGRQVQAITLPVNLEVFDEEDDNRKTKLTELYRMIRTLGPLERALILLWLEERSYEEIARIMGLTKTNVGVRLNRIKEKLKNMSN